ncbi:MULTISPECIES: RagB/SusD family nutrient uptake outer membrane protein [Alistipes]|nr:MULTISPECIES: RagB/SusD family nutrient uptake outer membrane protein [Alistipes]MBQ4903225.1 RagB/SusD family nutrient uptake outer membrane protein [Alistipes sp. Marseille-P2263]MCI2258979.1 RagB/SusD family nutrient uptake outer membrane protein [Alistipes dispar]
MKKTILTMGLAAALCGTSCSDVIDLNPGDRFSPATVWSSTTTVDSYVLGLYSIFSSSCEFYGTGSPNLTDAYSDILKSGSWDQYNHSYNRSLFQESAFNSTSAGAFECWSTHYERIRRENEFLRDAPKYREKFGEKWMDTRIAEVRFCRAYAYYLLCRVYGGVILRTEVDGPEQNDKARSTEADCWDFIIEELKDLAPQLPQGNKTENGDNWDDANYGRATQQAAYGLLSRVALFAERWDVAAQAARDVEKCGGALDLTGYANVFNGDLKSNKEILFGVDFEQDVITHRYDAYVRPSGDAKALGTSALYSVFFPTSELADSYEMADGTPFSWETHGSDPYTGREPRFYATILYNGASWMGRTIESYVGGADGFKEYENSKSANTTVTGYYLRKYLKDGDKSWITAYSAQTCILIRYAEVLLNKAEALAELSWDQNSVEALQALNDVRGRVGLPSRQTASKEEFMEFVRHERMVELAGEGFRYWDLRRWRLAEEVINGKNVHGVKITKTDSGFNYEHVDADNGNKRIFYDRYYHFAIPESERSKNPLCDNNQGWV